MRLPRIAGLPAFEKFVVIEPDGEGSDLYRSAIESNGAVIGDIGLQFLAAIAEEAVDRFLILKTDQVVGQHRAHQPFVERQRDQQIARWPWDVEEKPDPVLVAARTQPLAQRDQVVVVHPHGVFGVD